MSCQGDVEDQAEIDFPLLQSLLKDRRKQIDILEVGQLLRLDDDDEEDSECLKEIMRVLDAMGFRKYSSFKKVNINIFKDHISRFSNVISYKTYLMFNISYLFSDISLPP